MVLISVLALIVLTSFSAVSAGLFDLGSDSNELDGKLVNGSITVTSCSVKETSSIGVIPVLNNGSSDIQSGYKYEASISIDISKADSGAKNKLQEIINTNAFGEGNFTTDSDYFNNQADGRLFKATLNGDILTITDIWYDTESKADGVSPGTVPIKSGKFLIFDFDDKNNNITLNF